MNGNQESDDFDTMQHKNQPFGSEIDFGAKIDPSSGINAKHNKEKFSS